MQPALGVPLGLEDRLVGAAGDQARVGACRPAAPPRARSRPRACSGGPSRSRRASAVGADAGEGVEVAAAGEHLRLAGAVEGRATIWFSASPSPWTSRTQTTVRPSGAEPEVGVAQAGRALRLRRDRHRLLAQPLPVEPLVGEVDEEDEVVGDQRPGAAAVLVDAGAHVGALAGVDRSLAASPAAPPHQDHAPALGRPPFRPPDGAVAGQGRRRQPPPAVGHHRGARSASARSRRERSSPSRRSLGPAIGELGAL